MLKRTIIKGIKMKAYEDIASEQIQERVEDGYQDSKALISYYLNIKFHLDYGEEREFICDNSLDKGLDALYIDDENEEIYFIQSKYHKNFEKENIKEKELKDFIGTLKQFDSKINIDALLNENTNKDLKRLIEDFDLANKVATYEIHNLFISNGKNTTDAETYAKKANIELQLLSDFELLHTQLYSEEIQTTKINFDFFPLNKQYIKTTLGSYIFEMRTKDLVKISGIDNNKVFSKNVRGWLGRGKVYKNIKSNLVDSTYKQENNILLHNGITIICETLKLEANTKLIVENLSIVNGAQSTYAFYENFDKLINKNTVLIKLIPLKNINNPLSTDIVYCSNNQTQVKMSDLRGLSIKSKQIQRLFKDDVLSKWDIKIKAGTKKVSNPSRIEINLDTLAQYSASFYLNNHVIAQSKTKLLDIYFKDVFNSKYQYTNYTILLLLSDIIDKVIKEEKDSFEEQEMKLLSTYYLTKLFIFNFLNYIYTSVHKEDFLDKMYVNKFILKLKEDNVYVKSLEKSIGDTVLGISEYLEDNKIDDYVSLLKKTSDSDMLILELSQKYKRQIKRNPADTIKIPA